MLPYLDPNEPIASRVGDLASRLTLEEKITQLLHANAPIERLGISGYNWWNEACHGIGRNGRATIFPQVIGLAATWNRLLIKNVATIISDEARAKYNTATQQGRHGQYQGLTFWTPNINILRDPRWGRGQETFGEDPYLTGELGLAMVQGLQGDHPTYLKVAACAKHFAVHSGPESQRHGFDVSPSDRDLHETYLPAFKKLVDGGVEAVMGAYNRVFGEPCCASKTLLGDILRERWKFQGHVVSDCGALDDIYRDHGSAKTAAEAAALALKAGCDLNCGSTFQQLQTAFSQGLVNEAEIDTALKRVLTAKFKLGLFDSPDRIPWSQIPASVVDSAEHRSLARKAAVESIVLLKNNGVLPLARNPESLLVTGPTAASVGVLLGNYSGLSGQLVTILEGIAERIQEGTRLSYFQGCPLDSAPASGVNAALGTASESEITIAVVGLDPTLEGEEGDAVSSARSGDRAVIELPKVQTDFLTELRKTAKKLVVIMTGGGAIAAPEVYELADAILHVWYPGCEGGHAVADILFGHLSPSGKMPLTVPMRTADLPAFEDYSMKGRTYRYQQKEPLYPFGFGLGYANFSYGEMKLETTTIAPGGSVRVKTTIRNTGHRYGIEVVQCYILPPLEWTDAPQSSLIDFRKIQIPALASVDIEFTVPASAFSLVNDAGESVHRPGTYKVRIGSSSPGFRSLALGAPPPSSAEIQVL